MSAYRKRLVSSKRISSDGLAEAEGEDDGLGGGDPGDGVLVAAVLRDLKAGLGIHKSSVLGRGVTYESRLKVHQDVAYAR